MLKLRDQKVIQMTSKTNFPVRNSLSSGNSKLRHFYLSALWNEQKNFHPTIQIVKLEPLAATVMHQKLLFRVPSATRRSWNPSGSNTKTVRSLQWHENVLLSSMTKSESLLKVKEWTETSNGSRRTEPHHQQRKKSGRSWQRTWKLGWSADSCQQHGPLTVRFKNFHLCG